MSDELAPYLRLPLSFDRGRTQSGSLTESISDNIRLLLHNQIQGNAKPKGVPGDPDYGAALPHHEFERGRPQDVVRAIRVAVKRHEPRLALESIEYANKTPGRYLPYSQVRITGKVIATGESLKLDLEIRE